MYAPDLTFRFDRTVRAFTGGLGDCVHLATMMDLLRKTGQNLPKVWTHYNDLLRLLDLPVADQPHWRGCYWSWPYERCGNKTTFTRNHIEMNLLDGLNWNDLCNHYPSVAVDPLPIGDVLVHLDRCHSFRPAKVCHAGLNDSVIHEHAGTHWDDVVRASEKSIVRLCRIMRGAKLVISNDSGPLHLARLLRVPAIGYFLENGHKSEFVSLPWHDVVVVGGQFAGKEKYGKVVLQR